MVRTRLAELRARARAVERAERVLDDARVARDESIRVAHAEGVPVPQIMAATGLSRPMVYRVIGQERE